MIGFKIIDIENFTYTLKSEDNKTQKLIFEFYGFQPEVENVICFNEKLLDRTSESFCQPYAFELTSYTEYVDDGEFMAVMQNNITYILKRVYG